MAERHSSAPPGPVTPDGSVIPARLRIVGWIVLTTGLGLLAVVLTIRSTLLTDVEQAANADVIQEVDEFRTFAERGRDPQTGGPIGSAERLLSLFLERQFPSESEVLVGYDRAAAAAGGSPLIVQTAQDPFGLLTDRGLIEGLVANPESSGIATTGTGAEFRWGKADIQAGATSDGVFLVAEFLGPTRAEELDDVQVIMLVCLGGLLLTAGIAYVVAGQILGPVRAVRRAASQITRADLSRRIEVRGRDDVAALALTFNAMLDRLDQAFRAHQSFSATAGRHLRAPLAVLADDRHGPDARHAALDQITTILDDLDVLSISQAPGFVDPAPVDIAELTTRLAADARALSSHEWTVEAAAVGTAELDQQRVRQAVRCLARNALREHTGPALLRLGTAVVDDALEVWVSDDGPGLDPDVARRVLDRYQDQQPNTDTDTDTAAAAGTTGETGGAVGPGLGLAVVRAVADAHHGSAWVETEPGHGATFGLRLPLTHDSPGADTPTPTSARSTPFRGARTAADTPASAGSPAGRS